MKKPDSSRKVFSYFAIRLAAIFVIIIIVVLVILSRLPPRQACTLIGCSDSLTLEFSHPLPQSYTIQLSTTGGESVQVSCPSGSVSGQASTGGNITARCQAGSLALEGFTPQQVTILVTWQSGSYKQDANPSYQTVQPNGPNCPPTCRQATMPLSLP
jgi:hypothetical protein